MAYACALVIRAHGPLSEIAAAVGLGHSGGLRQGAKLDVAAIALVRATILERFPRAAV